MRQHISRHEAFRKATKVNLGSTSRSGACVTLSKGKKKTKDIPISENFLHGPEPTVNWVITLECGCNSVTQEPQGCENNFGVFSPSLVTAPALRRCLRSATGTKVHRGVNSPALISSWCERQIPNISFVANRISLHKKRLSCRVPTHT